MVDVLVTGGAGFIGSNLVRYALGAHDNWRITRVPDRPGHDRRYSLNTGNVQGLGWRPQVPFADGLGATVEWYVANEWWWRPIKQQDAAFKTHYEAQYGKR
jgi:dTDP-glucose 4,6-dehydratase